MGRRTSVQKEEIVARVLAFPYCGFSSQVTGNICYHYKSFVGRDFKAFIQMAVFVVSPYISQEELKCWILLSKVMHSLLLSIKLFFFTRFFK